MATELKNAFAEIVNRLDAACNATGTGGYGLLEGVTLIEGPTEYTFTLQQMPVIIYEILSGGIAEDTHFPNKSRIKFTMLFSIMTDAEQGYYHADGWGIIDLTEKLMTVLDQNDAGILDLNGAGTWGPTPPQYKIGSFERSSMINTYLMEAEFQTNRFSRGSLRS